MFEAHTAGCPQRWARWSQTDFGEGGGPPEPGVALGAALSEYLELAVAVCVHNVHNVRKLGMQRFTAAQPAAALGYDATGLVAVR